MNRGPDYDEIRRKLVERGYLQGPVERFLLADLLRRGARRALFGTASRAAAIAGALIGLLLAGAAAFTQPLLAARDLPLLWLYFSLAATIILAALDLLAAAWVTARAARHGEPALDGSWSAGLVALPTLGYLLYLWWRHRPAGGLLADLLFGVLALSATFAVARLAGLVSLSGIVGRTGTVPRRDRRGSPLLLGLLAAISGGFVAVRGAIARSEVAAEPPAFDVAGQAPALWWIGIDGLDSELVATLEPEGAVAPLVALMEQGSTFPLRRRRVDEPAVAWTTYLTGVPAERHGVHGAGSAVLPGVATPFAESTRPVVLGVALRFLVPTRTVPTSGLVRRARTLWEIVGLKRPAAAIGWWASWPAPDTEVYVITDRVLPKLLAGAAEDRDAAPAGLFARLREDFPADQHGLRESFADAAPAPLSEAAARTLWESYLTDAYAWRLAERLQGDGRLAATFVYLPGLDRLRFRLRDDPPEGLDSIAAARLVAWYVRWLGTMVAGARGGADRQLFVLADPGRAASRSAEGFVVIGGGGVAPHCVGPVLDELQPASLALTLLGFPRARDMAAPPAACGAGAVGESAPPTVASYGPPPRPAGDPRSPYDEQMLKRLKSLGYVH
ncbi:MAG TPA: hypothetical protein VJS92_15520 [Candidatus Polarisedimenticolaceae bacterium]|nr:hypothetical protein [Candidatus Polarisedimenticolaceae bacterium]